MGFWTNISLEIEYDAVISRIVLKRKDELIWMPCYISWDICHTYRNSVRQTQNTLNLNVKSIWIVYFSEHYAKTWLRRLFVLTFEKFNSWLWTIFSHTRRLSQCECQVRGAKHYFNHDSNALQRRQNNACNTSHNMSILRGESKRNVILSYKTLSFPSACASSWMRCM